MRGLQNAPFYPKIASCMVTQLARAALDSEGAQLEYLLSAIQSQMDKENMHQVRDADFVGLVCQVRNGKAFPISLTLMELP